MQRSIKKIIGTKLFSKEGTIGKVKDCLFDDNIWVLRYLVADTGTWLPGRKVLISQLHLESPGVGLLSKQFPVNLTKRQIEESPDLDINAPVSRQYEQAYANYHKTSVYWDTALMPVFPAPSVTGVSSQSSKLDENAERKHREQLERIKYSNLRSSDEILGYSIQASDGEFGHVEDFILEDNTWKFRYLVIDSKNWLPGKKFLIDVDWVEAFDWEQQSASVGISRSTIENAPVFDPHEPINKDDLENLYDYYGHVVRKR